MTEETKTSEEEPKTVPFPDFLNKSFECLFNQNVHLHRALAQVLQEEFKKQEERQSQLEEKIDVLEKNLKEGFLHYTREIIKGLDVTTQALLDTIAPPLDQIPAPILARRSSPVSVMDSIIETENEI
jgi:hypothetical protein